MSLPYGYNRGDVSGNKTSQPDGLCRWEVLTVLFDHFSVSELCVGIARTRSETRDRLARARQVAKVAVLCTGLILLSGCAKRLRLLPPKPLSPKQTAAAFEERTLENPGLKRYVEASLTRGTKARCRSIASTRRRSTW